MNKILPLFLLLSFGCTFSQTHKATYSLLVQSDPNNGDTQLADEINPLAEENEFYLYFDKTQSYYTSHNTESNTSDLSDIIGMGDISLKYNYHQNTFQEKILIEKLYHYTYSNETNWTITNETKMIDGYHCIKANGIVTEVGSSGRKIKIEAWFAPEINYPVGPGRYAGLPGIIVYLIYENIITLKLNKIKFNDNSIDITTIKHKGDPLSEDKYIEFLSRF